MITEIHFKNGSSKGKAALVLPNNPAVTIFVGPNNSGKSQALREITAFCNAGQKNQANVILEKLVFQESGMEWAQEEFKKQKQTPVLGDNIPESESIILVGKGRTTVNNAEFLQSLAAPNQSEHRSNLFAQWYLRGLTLSLDGPSRIGLVNAQKRGDLKNPEHPFAILLTNDTKRENLRKVIREGIGLNIAIDASEGDFLKLRFGKDVPPDERSLKDDTLQYMREAQPVQNLSDGVKAYTGILLQLYSGESKVIVIDEPEAFLHPSLAQKLGKEIAKSATEEGKRVFVSTHSPQFVMGAILSGAKVNIVRLTYESEVATARLLPSEDLNILMNDPLLRSVGVLSGLFYNHVIVGEANADRAFYQEINERLLAAGDNRGISHTLFLNADNKQTIPRILAPLRKLGIPAAGIADIDIVKDGGSEWTKYLEACCVPPSDHQPWGTRRASMLKALENKDIDFKMRGGIELLSGSEKEAAENLLDDLDRYGLFVVRSGEVENWLSGLNIPRTKNTWLRSIFERMGADPALPNYAKPSAGDVWDFVGKIGGWLSNPERKGIPF